MDDKKQPVTAPTLSRRLSEPLREPSFKELCAILQRCYRACPTQSITDLADVARTVLAKQRLGVDVAVFNRAIDAVMASQSKAEQMPGEFKRTIDAKPVGEYRSQLEFRWACILTSAGLQPEYERHRFHDLAIPYVPDFYLPTRKVWLEIKPLLPDDEARTKAQLLAERVSQPVYILAGQPTVFGKTPGFISLRFNKDGLIGEDLGWATPEVLQLLEPSDEINWELIAAKLAATGLINPVELGTVRARRRAEADADRASEALAKDDLKSERGRQIAVEVRSKRDRSLPAYLQEHAPVKGVRYRNESLPAYLWEIAISEKS